MLFNSNQSKNEHYDHILVRLSQIDFEFMNLESFIKGYRHLSTFNFNKIESTNEKDALLHLTQFMTCCYNLYLTYLYAKDNVIVGDNLTATLNVSSKTHTCSFCSKKFRSKGLIPPHSIEINNPNSIDNEEAIDRIGCPGRNFLPLEYSPNGLFPRLIFAKRQLDQMALEKIKLDFSKTLIVRGKYSTHTYTPSHLSWNDRIFCAKSELQSKIDQHSINVLLIQKMIEDWVHVEESIQTSFRKIS